MLGIVRQLAYVPAILVFSTSLLMSQSQPKSQCVAGTQATAHHLRHGIQLDAGHPAGEWAEAVPISFCANWQGKNADPERTTTVRLLWTTETLYLRFECRYRDLFVFDDSENNGRRDHLWDRDVAEVFLQPDPSRLREYKEFEVSPNGMWIDLDISNGTLADLKSGLAHSASITKSSHEWVAELAIPMKALTATFDPKSDWHVNFFRVEGKQEPRNYYAWRPTKTAQPNFHVPEAFGTLRFLP